MGKFYILPNVEGNTEVATVDDISLVREDPTPKELSDEQYERLSAVQKLEEVNEDGKPLEGKPDPIDRLRTHAELDAALARAGVTVAEETSVEDKQQALKDKRDNDDQS